jgi:hypothetical protein
MAKNGPGGKEVGRVSVRVVPDTSKFAEELKRELKKLEKQLKIQIPVSIDQSGIKEEIKKVQKSADGKEIKLDAEVDGDGVVKKTRRIKNLAQKAVGAIKFTLGINTAESIARVRAEMTVIKKVVQGYNIRIPIDVVGWTKVLAIAGLISAAFLTTQNIIGGIGGALSAIGGALATIPALAVGAAASIGVLATGLSGFFSTLGEASNPEKFAQALKNLAPNAQKAAKQLAAFRPALSEIRKATQQQLFKDMNKEFARFAALFPVIKTGFVGIASGMRGMFTDWIRMATSLQSVRDIRTMLLNTKQGFQAARPAAANFGKALRDLATVGSSFFPRMGKAITDMSKTFADFIAKARKTGELRAWIENAIETFKQLGRIIGNVWGIFADIREGMAAGDVGFLDILERATKTLRELTSSDEGQQFFKDLADVMREVLDVAEDVFKQLFRTISDTLGDAMPFLREFIKDFGVALVAALKAVTPLLQSVARWLSENKEIMAPLAVALVGIVTAFKLIVTAANGIKAVKTSFDAIKAAAGITKIALVGENGSGGLVNAIKQIGLGIGSGAKKVASKTAEMAKSFAGVAVDAGSAAKSTVSKWASAAKDLGSKTFSKVSDWAGKWISGFATISKEAVSKAATVVKTWATSLLTMLADTIKTFGKVVATTVAGWATMAAAAMKNAIRIGIAWLIANPWLLIVAAVAALVYLIVSNWDAIWSTTKKIFGAIWDFIVFIFNKVKDWIGGFIGGIVDWFKAFPGRVGGALGALGMTLWQKGLDLLNGLWNGIKWVATKIWDWFSGLASKIGGFFADAGSWLWNAGKNIVQGLCDGIISMYNSVLDAMGLITKDLKGGFEAELKIHSPSRVFHQYGVYTVQGLVNGLRQSSELANKASRDLATGMTSAFSADFQAGQAVTDSIQAATPEAIKSMEDLLNKVNSNAETTWKGTLEADPASMADAVQEALAGWTVLQDPQGLWRMVKKQDTLNARRR